MKVLVVEDDSILREAVVTLLQEEGYSVDEVATGDEGLFMAEQGIHDLVVLDIMLPEVSGLEIVRSLREGGSTVPILLLTARDTIDDRVVGLETGADDYLVKPFAIRELLARVKALIRRKSSVGFEGELSYGGLALKSKIHDAFIGAKALGLTAKEYEVLEFLVINKEQILTKDQIFDRIWGFDSETTISIVDLYIHYLRKKLAVFGLDVMIQTVRGAGFMLKEKQHV